MTFEAGDTNSRLRYNTRNKTDQKQIYKGNLLTSALFSATFIFVFEERLLFSRHDFDRNYFCDILDTC